MIRMFVQKDLERINPNNFTDLTLFKSRLFDSNTPMYTLVDGEEVIAIIIIQNYIGNNYMGGFLISNDIKMSHVKELRKTIYDWIEAESVERVETISLDCDIINRWHEFLGLTCEGVKRKYAQGKDYKMWAWVRDGR